MINVTSNIDEVIQKFEAKAAKLKEVDFSEALVAGVNAAMAKMKFRIFNKGLDAENITLGKYTGKKKTFNFRSKKLKAAAKKAGTSDFTAYELKRISKGRQVAYKDLEFNGALRRAIVVVKESKTRVSCVLVNDVQAFIAASLEEQIAAIRSGTQATRGGPKVRIFGLSKEENEFFRTNTRAALIQIYDRVLQS